MSIALVAAAILIGSGGPLKHGAAHTGSLLLSAGGGAIGALLSIAYAFRDRSVAPDHDIVTNAVDGGIRVLIGTIGGAAFNLFLSAGLLIGLTPVGAAQGAAPTHFAGTWAAALAAGIVAGFIERFMPDLVNRFGAQQGGAAGTGAQAPAATSTQNVQQQPLTNPTQARQPSGVISRRGGVSPRVGTVTPGIPTAAPTGGPTPSYPNFTYHGGRIVARPQVYLSFWGDKWKTSALQPRADHLTQFLTDLVSSDFMNVVHQYGVGLGEYKSSSYLDANVPSDLTDQDIKRLLQSLIDTNAVPEPTGSQTCVIVYLQEGISVHDGTTMCAATSDDLWISLLYDHTLYYAVIPALGDACLQASCPGGDNVCSLKLSQPQEDRITQVTAHEFAEMTTDPQLDGWFDPDPGTGEVGDVTNGKPGEIVVSGRRWAVQAIYSKYHDTGRPGANFAVASSAAPVPLRPMVQLRPDVGRNVICGVRGVQDGFRVSPRA